MSGIKSYGITLHHKPENTLRQLLVGPKDPPTGIPVWTSLLYGKQCGMDCIGEMARTFKASVSERRRPSSSTSKVSDHLFREHRGHQFQSENVRIPDRKPDRFRRGIKEAIYIPQLQSSLNRDGGRYQLLGEQSFEVTALLTVLAQ